jgi:ABC-type nitrate/sulfonate/bicarbonate transport system substrate-binding protein
MNRQRFCLGLAALGGAPSIACAQAPVMTVRLAMLVPSALTWLHHIAEARNFYREAGISVQAMQVADSPTLLQAVASGSADAGFSLGDVVMRAIDQNAPVIMAGAILDHAALRLFGAPGIRHLGDLAGKRVTAGALTGGTTNLMLYQLKTRGVDVKTLQVVAIPNSRDRIVALQTGQLSGAELLAPFDIVAQRASMAVLDVYREPYVETPLVYNVGWAKGNRPAAVAMAKALRRASEWIYTPANRAAAVSILAEATNGQRDISDASYEFLVVEQKAFAKGLHVPEAGLRNILKIDEAVNGTSTPFTFSKYYDPSYLMAKG